MVRAVAGCIVSIAHDGVPSIRRSFEVLALLLLLLWLGPTGRHREVDGPTSPCDAAADGPPWMPYDKARSPVQSALSTAVPQVRRDLGLVRGLAVHVVHETLRGVGVKFVAVFVIPAAARLQPVPQIHIVVLQPSRLGPVAAPPPIITAVLLEPTNGDGCRCCCGITP
eukprot:gene12866-biopygen8609